MDEALPVRPYELLCLLCAEGQAFTGPRADRVAALRRYLSDRPDGPVRLCCNALDVYAYQDPGPADDTPEGAEFNRKRDLDLLQRLDLAPGSVLPARTLLYRVLKAVPSVRGLCGYDGVTAEAWKGCDRAAGGYYEAGHARGIDALIPPRDPREMERDKREAVRAMESGQPLRIRPHVIMCAVCNYGKNEGQSVPLAEDNIVEFIQIILANPEVPVVMAQGADWMICASCPRRVADLNACVNVAGSGGLSNEKRDLDLLQLLGLRYEDALPGAQMLQLIFQRVPSTTLICKRDNPTLSVWWDGCGESNCATGNAGYVRGRELLIEKLSLAV